jgi:hypothetical protein
MRPIGGEIEFKLPEEMIYYTDSGRSSLKVFMQNHKNLKYLIPDFLCKVIVDVFKKENVRFEFYKINEDLSIDLDSILYKEFDVIYIINYFGIYQNLNFDILKDKIVIEDNVFFYDFENRYAFPRWFGFNSYRKISHLADGSLIKTNLNLKFNLKKDNLFSSKKYIAKKLKYDYIHNKSGTEENYLSIFKKAENIIDGQKNIYHISEQSIYLLSKMNWDFIQSIRKKRFFQLYNEFYDFCVNKNPSCFSYFVIKHNERDKIRKDLFNYKIYLPIHWSDSVSNNLLYDQLLSIPLFENYNDEDFNYLFSKIKSILILRG